MSSDSPPTAAASVATVIQAYLRIKHDIHATPVLTSHTMDALAGRSLLWKCENLQKGKAVQLI